ncbi:RGS domain-containing protein [Paraphysoderma sedebokerense]|nr:RGS domain-containing protein [Paraphysoderma sedebokerense]
MKETESQTESQTGSFIGFGDSASNYRNDPSIRTFVAGEGGVPTLEQVLARKTCPPVSLYNFYLYLKEKEHSAENIDFWLDLDAHTNLWKIYYKQLYSGSGVSNRQNGAPINAKTSVKIEIDGKIKVVNDRNVSKSEVIKNAQKLFETYLLPGGKKELNIPQPVRKSVDEALNQGKRFDPSVFAEVKQHIFETMNMDSYPRFLTSSYSTNLTYMHTMFRLVVGLICITAAMSWIFTYIFLDVRPITSRFVASPILWDLSICGQNMRSSDPVGFFFLCGLRAVFALAGVTETTFFHFNRIRDMKARKAHITKGLKMVVKNTIVTAIVFLPFILVPVLMMKETSSQTRSQTSSQTKSQTSSQTGSFIGLGDSASNFRNDPSVKTFIAGEGGVPTLEQVLSRKTGPPVSLYHFYLYLKEKEHSAENIDFWVDLDAHANLWKVYYKQLYSGSGVSNRHNGAPINAKTSVKIEVDGKIKVVNTRNVSKSEVIKNAQRLFETYLLPGGKKELNIPQPIRKSVEEALNKGKRFDPSVFADVKQHILETMNMDSYPRFLASSYSTNLTYMHSMLRLVIGLICISAALSWIFTYIFLDVRPVTSRFVASPILWFGFINMWAKHEEL